MKSRLSKEYKQKFDELRVLINSWNFIPNSPLDEFDSLNHLFLNLLYKETNKLKIEQTILFELMNNYGFSSELINAKKLTQEVLTWWNNSKK